MSDDVACSKCGAFGELPHQWVEGDCVLPHRGHSKATVGHVCRRCVDRHRDWLREIVELYATLGEVIPLGSIPDDTADHKHQRKRPASPALVRLDAWAMLHDRARLRAMVRDENNPDKWVAADSGSNLPDVPSVIGALAGRLWEEVYGTDRDGEWTLTAAAAHLTTHAEQAARSPWVDEYDADLRWVRTALRRAHAITDTQALGRCITVTDGRDCPGQVWPTRDGTRPKCDRCQRRYGPTDLARLKIMEEGRTA